jgi:phospholipase C
MYTHLIFFFLAFQSVVSAVTYTVSESPSCVLKGGSITTTWTVTGGSALNGADWIGIYASGRCTNTIGSSCPTNADAWAYVSTASPNSATAGTVTITAPSPAVDTTYYAYYLYNGGYVIKAFSTLFTVKATCGGGGGVTLTASPTSIAVNTALTFTWSGATTTDTNNWVVFTSSGVPSSSNYLGNSWSYTYGDQYATGAAVTATGSVKVTSPQTAGTYTAYFCRNNGYTCSASTTITVTAATIPTVSCKSAGQTTSTVKHIIVVLSENHSFDSIYGRYCTATTGSNPTCNTGPSCCEKPPSTVSGSSATLLSDSNNVGTDRPHSFAAEACMINKGGMDKYVTGCSGSSAASNFATADSTSAANYFSWAGSYAMSDRFFQSVVGASCSNDMVFATGKYMFKDNAYVPQNSNLNGANCYSSSFISYSDPTIANLLNQCSVPWTFYAEGYGANPKSPNCYPSYYDASDNPFTYFPSLTGAANAATTFRDYTALFTDISGGTLPSVSYVKGLGTHSEHPGISTLTAGETISQNIINAVMGSSTYNQNTVVFMVPDESGGFYDHISPPSISSVDGKMYGPRTQFVAVGYQTKQNYISHVQIEPSSIIKFIEWNWFNGSPGQLGARDATVNNLGDLFDSTRTGVTIPSN